MLEGVSETSEDGGDDAPDFDEVSAARRATALFLDCLAKMQSALSAVRQEVKRRGTDTYMRKIHKNVVG